MYYLKPFHLFLLATFFPLVFFSYDSRFDLKKLKKDFVAQEKKVDTVVVNKKKSSTISFIESAKGLFGVSFFFERVVPSSWRRVLGFKRAVFVNFITIITALTNLGLCGYFVLIYHPSAIAHIKALYRYRTDDPTPLKPSLLPLVDPIVKPSQPDPIVVSIDPVPPIGKPVEQKPGEFD